MQIGRSAGEGSTVNIRGVAQVETTLNGEEYLNAGGGSLGSGSANFVDVPPTLFKGVDVIKSTTAANLAGGISGIINLKTHRPFDFDKGWTFSGQAQGSEGGRVHKLNKEFSALASYRTARWGALITASYSDAHLENQLSNVGNSGTKATEADVGFDFNGDGVIGNNTDPGHQPSDYYYDWAFATLGHRTTHRKRSGVNGSFQFKFNDALTLVADAAYTKLDDLTNTITINPQTNNAVTGLQPGAEIDSNGVLLRGVTNYPQFSIHSQAEPSKAQSINTNLELRFDNGGMFSGSLRWVHGHAWRSYALAGADAQPVPGSVVPFPDGTMGHVNPNGIPGNINAQVDYTGTYPSITMVSDVTNPKNYVLMSTWGQASRMNSGMNVFRADGTLHFDSDVFNSLQFGARYDKRKYVFNSYRYLAPEAPAGSCASPQQAPYFFHDPNILDACTGYSEANVRPLLSLPAGFLTYENDFSPDKVNGIGSRGVPAINPDVMTHPGAYLEGLYPGEKLYRQAPDSYRVQDRTTSIYAQLNLGGAQLGAIDMPWTANIGVRGVRTQLTVSSYRTDSAIFIGNPAAWNGVNPSLGIDTTRNEYTDWLPSVNVSFNVTDNQKLRLAYNKAVARQSLPDLGKGLQVGYYNNGTPPHNPNLPSTAELFQGGSSGNPELKPFRSDNYNASYEWYFAKESMVSLGAYFMKVKSFPEQITRHEDQPDADGVVREGGPVTRFVNGGGAQIKGLEFSYRQAFTFLPGMLGGLGTNLNYTYSKATTGQRDIEGNVLPVPNNARDQYNAALWYQKGSLRARVAYNWRSRRFDTINSAIGGDQLAIWNKPSGYLDASVNYAINKNLSVYLQGVNLTDEHESQYAQWQDQFYSQNVTEKRYFAGVRVRF